jgi:energy-converting hydrogenase Eha subunit E
MVVNVGNALHAELVIQHLNTEIKMIDVMLMFFALTGMAFWIFMGFVLFTIWAKK